MTPATTMKAEPSKAARPSSTKISVQFVYAPGLKRAVFRNVRLTGSWDREGRYSDDWSTIPMEEYTGEDGCPCYRAAVGLDESQVGWTFRWGVVVDGPAGRDKWGITTEVRDALSSDRSRAFALRPRDGDAVQQERYYLTHNRRLGAQKHRRRGRRRTASASRSGRPTPGRSRSSSASSSTSTTPSGPRARTRCRRPQSPAATSPTTARGCTPSGDRSR